jgi:glucosyl-dolichyl phosphate glucuronosyltransferase
MWPMAPTYSPARLSLSLIVPTYSRPEGLVRMLASVADQSAVDVEVIVVDNAPNPRVRRVVTEASEVAAAPIRYVAEPTLGLHNARHAGAHAASGDILVFTDDDATFDPGWLDAYARAFEDHPEMAAAGGPVRPIWEVSPPAWLMKFVDPRYFPPLSLMDAHDEFQLGAQVVFFGVNMAIRRDALFQAGGFNPEAFGSQWLGNGETGLLHKLRDAGGRIGYVPDAVAYHHIPPARMTAQYLCNRMALEGACTEYGAFHATAPGVARVAARAGRVGIDLVAAASRDLGRAALRADAFWRLRIRMTTAYHAARLRYLSRLARDDALRSLVLEENWLNKKEEVPPSRSHRR